MEEEEKSEEENRKEEEEKKKEEEKERQRKKAGWWKRRGKWRRGGGRGGRGGGGSGPLNRKEVYLTLGAHAQRGLLYLVCLSVSVSTTILALQAASERYQQLQRNKRSKIKKAILLKRRCSRKELD